MNTIFKKVVTEIKQNISIYILALGFCFILTGISILSGCASPSKIPDELFTGQKEFLASLEAEQENLSEENSEEILNETESEEIKELTFADIFDKNILPENPMLIASYEQNTKAISLYGGKTEEYTYYEISSLESETNESILIKVYAQKDSPIKVYTNTTLLKEGKKKGTLELKTEEKYYQIDDSKEEYNSYLRDFPEMLKVSAFFDENNVMHYSFIQNIDESDEYSITLSDESTRLIQVKEKQLKEVSFYDFNKGSTNKLNILTFDGIEEDIFLKDDIKWESVTEDIIFSVMNNPLLQLEDIVIEETTEELEENLEENIVG